MNRLLLMLLIIAFAAYSNFEANSNTVESLAADPERLQALREQCLIDRTGTGDALCKVAAEAIRRRFFSDGEVPYTPPKESPKF